MLSAALLSELILIIKNKQMNNTVLIKTMQDIKDYVKSLNTPDNKVYQENELLIMSCFSKAMELIEANLPLEQKQISDAVDDTQNMLIVNDIIVATLGGDGTLGQHYFKTKYNVKGKYAISLLLGS